MKKTTTTDNTPPEEKTSVVTSTEPGGLVTHFPWQRFVMTAVINLSMILVLQKLVDWLYYFTIIPATIQSNASVIVASITALSAAVGVIFVCMAAVNIWFITGSAKTVESMFKFNAATMAQSTVQAVSETINENRKEEHTEHVIEEGQPGSPERRPFRQYEDE